MVYMGSSFSSERTSDTKIKRTFLGAITQSKQACWDRRLSGGSGLGVLCLPRSGSSSGVLGPRRCLGGISGVAGLEELLARGAVLKLLLLGGELVRGSDIVDGVLLGHALLGLGGVLGEVLGARAPVLLSHGREALAHLGDGDMILAIDGEPVTDVAAVKTKMEKVVAAKPSAVVLHVRRGIRTFFVEMETGFTK